MKNNLAQALIVPNNIIEVDFRAPEQRRSTSLYKSNGVPKATAADPIRDPAHIRAMQEYYLSKGSLRNYTLFTVGILFGLRASDLLNLRIHHVLKPDGTFKSHCDLIEAKTRKFNNPALTPEIQQLLKDYLDTLPEYSLDDPLFASQKRNKDGNRKSLTLQQLTTILKDASKACNVPGHISTHSLRKTFAYQLLQRNPNDDDVKFALQKMLNHNDFKTTLAYCGQTQDVIDHYRADLAQAVL